MMACKTAEQVITFADIKRYNRILQGEIWLADLGERSGNIQSGKRPVIVLQNDVGNKYSPTTIVVPLTSQIKNLLPVHCDVGVECGLKKTSTSLMEQITTINQSQLIKRIGALDVEGYKAIKSAIVASFKGIL